MAVAVLREVTIAERFEQESIYAWTVRRDKKVARCGEVAVSGGTTLFNIPLGIPVSFLVSK